MDDLTIEKIISDNLNEYLNSSRTKISPAVFSDIVDYMKFSAATEYLKLTDWNQTVSISDIATMTFRNGQYFFRDESGNINSILFHHFIMNDASNIRKKSYRNPQSVKPENKQEHEVYKSYSEHEFKSYYNSLLNFYNIMNHDIIKGDIIRKNKSELDIEPTKRKHTMPKMKYYELVEFLSGYYMRENDALKNTYRQVNNAKFDAISFNNYNAMILYFKTVIKENIFNDDIFSTPMFRLYSYYNIEKRYMLETVKNVAASLRYMYVKRINSKDRELFLNEVVPLLRLPLLKTRNNLITSYLRSYKDRSLDKWRISAKMIKEIIYGTADKVGNDLNALNTDILHTLHKDLIREYEVSKTIERFNSFENDYECNIDFKTIDFDRVFEHYGKYLDGFKQNIKGYISEDYTDKLEPKSDFSEVESKLLAHSFENIVESTLQDIVRLIDTDSNIQ